MVNYEKAVIYKITCKNTEITDTYVGSTCNFRKRKSAHKYRCNNKKSKRHNLLVYKTIRANGGWDNWDMSIIEARPCDSKTELLNRERHWIEELKATLNCDIPRLTRKEYQEYQKEYRKKNRAIMKEKRREKITCECGSVITKDHLARHKRTKKHQDFIKSN